MSIQYGLSTWTHGPVALVCIYRKSEERVVEVPGASIAPGNRDVEDQFGNKPCFHLHTDGDLYCLPDQIQVAKESIAGWMYLVVNGSSLTGTGCTSLEFCAVGDNLSIEQNGSSVSFGPVLEYTAGDKFRGDYSGNVYYWGGYSGHCSGVVDRWGHCAANDDTDYNGFRWPWDDPSEGFKPGIDYSSFDIRSLIPNFNGYTYTDVIASIVLMLRGLLVEFLVVEATKDYWKQSLPECLVDALNGLRLLQIDSIAYLRDSAELRRSLSIYKEIKRRPLSKKTWADVFLTYRYGLRLYANDTLSIVKAIDKEVKRGIEPFQTARGMRRRSVKVPIGNPIEQVIRTKVYADNCSLADMGLINALRDIDLYPSLSNIWDLIPYSFVVDWFLPVGEILSRFDAQSDVQTLHTRSCVASVKSTKLDHIRGVFGYSGDIKTVCYQRKVLSPNDMSRALSSDSVKFLDGVTPIHFFDGLALRFQRR